MQRFTDDVDRDLPWLKKRLGISKPEEVAKVRSAVILLKEWARFSRVANHRKRLRTLGRRLVSAVRAVQRAFRAYISRRDAALELIMNRWGSWWGHLLSEDAKKERKDVVTKIRAILQVALKDCGLPTTLAEIEQQQLKQTAENTRVQTYKGSSHNLLGTHGEGGGSSQPGSGKGSPSGSRRSSVAGDGSTQSPTMAGRRGSSHTADGRYGLDATTNSEGGSNKLSDSHPTVTIVDEGGPLSTSTQSANRKASKADPKSEFYEMLPPHVTAAEILKFFESASTPDRATQVDYFALMDTIALLYREYSLAKTRHQREVSKLEKLIVNEGVEPTDKPSDFFGLDYEKIKKDRLADAEEKLAVIHTKFPSSFDPNRTDIKERYIITCFCHNVRLIGVTLAGSSRFAVAFLLKVALKTLRHRVPSWAVLRMYPEVAKVPSRHLDEHATAVAPVINANSPSTSGIRRRSLGGESPQQLLHGASTDSRRPSNTFVAFATTIDEEDVMAANEEGDGGEAAENAGVAGADSYGDGRRRSVGSLSPAALISSEGEVNGNNANVNFQQSSPYWRGRFRELNLKPCGRRPTKAPWCNKLRFYFELRNAEVFVENENLKSAIANNAVAAAAANAAASPLARRQSLAATYNTSAIQKRHSSTSPSNAALLRSPGKRGSNSLSPSNQNRKSIVNQKGITRKGWKLFSKKSVFDEDATDDDDDSDDSEKAAKKEGIEQMRRTRYNKAIRSHNYGEAVHRRQSLTVASLAAVSLNGSVASTNTSPAAQSLPPRLSGSVSRTTSAGRRSTGGTSTTPPATPETKLPNQLDVGELATSDHEAEVEHEAPHGIMYTARGDKHHKPSEATHAGEPTTIQDPPNEGLGGALIRRTDSANGPQSPSSPGYREDTAIELLGGNDIVQIGGGGSRATEIELVDTSGEADVHLPKATKAKHPSSGHHYDNSTVEALPDHRRAGSTVSYYQQLEANRRAPGANTISAKNSGVLLGNKALTPEMAKYLDRHARILGKPSLMDMKAVGRGHVRVVCKPRRAGSGVPQGTEFRPESSWGSNNDYNMPSNLSNSVNSALPQKRRYNSVGGRPQTPTATPEKRSSEVTPLHSSAGVGTLYRHNIPQPDGSPKSPSASVGLESTHSTHHPHNLSSSEIAKDRRQRIFNQPFISPKLGSRPTSANLSLSGAVVSTHLSESGGVHTANSPAASMLGQAPIVLGAVTLSGQKAFYGGAGAGGGKVTTLGSMNDDGIDVEGAKTPSPSKAGRSPSTTGLIEDNSFNAQLYKKTSPASPSSPPSQNSNFTFYPSYAHIHNSVANGRNTLAPLIVDPVFSMAANAQQKPKSRPINGPPPVTYVHNGGNNTVTAPPRLILLGSGAVTPPGSRTATPTIDPLKYTASSPSMVEINVNDSATPLKKQKENKDKVLEKAAIAEHPKDPTPLVVGSPSLKEPLSHVLQRPKSPSCTGTQSVFKEALDEEADKAKKRFWRHMRM